jgi:hypothetical protein
MLVSMHLYISLAINRCNVSGIMAASIEDVLLLLLLLLLLPLLLVVFDEDPLVSWVLVLLLFPMPPPPPPMDEEDAEADADEDEHEDELEHVERGERSMESVDCCCCGGECLGGEVLLW